MMSPAFSRAVCAWPHRWRATASAKIMAAVAANLNVNGNRCSCFSSRGLRVTIASYDGRAAMRWCVSIGAVLVAGAMAGGDVASVAAPNPKHQVADGKDNAAVGRCRTDPRRRCLLFDGHGRTRGPARGLCAGHRLEGIPAGAEEPAERQDCDDLFRMGGVERPEDHHSLAGDRRPGNRRRGRRRDHEDADPPGVAHLDLGRDLFRDAAVRRKTRIAGCGASSIFPATAPTTTARRSPARAIRRWQRASPSTACRSW